MDLKVAPRPDTDEHERERRLYHSLDKNLVFRECDTCAAKPGSPPLCSGCLHNREVISRLRLLATTQNTALKNLTKGR